MVGVQFAKLVQIFGEDVILVSFLFPFLFLMCLYPSEEEEDYDEEESRRQRHWLKQ